MEIIILLIGASLFVALIFLWAFVWANRSGQYDDNYTPSVRMLFDDQKPVPRSENQKTNTNDHGRTV
jgi:cbb3-type cytochrome oxidase maturation protein